MKEHRGNHFTIWMDIMSCDLFFYLILNPPEGVTTFVHGSGVGLGIERVHWWTDDTYTFSTYTTLRYDDSICTETIIKRARRDEVSGRPGAILVGVP
jgi:hypothetical protein